MPKMLGATTTVGAAGGLGERGRVQEGEGVVLTPVKSGPSLDGTRPVSALSGRVRAEEKTGCLQ